MGIGQTGLVYNPQFQSSDLTEKLFAARQKQFELLLNKILQEKENSIPQHYLIIGKRGMGKTTLLKRIEVELHKKQYRKRFIPLLYREEQYNVKDIADFWLNTLNALADSLQSETHHDAAGIDKTIQELSIKDPKIISEEAYKFLMSTCQNLQRRPVLLIDNLGLLFCRFTNKNNPEQWALRELLSKNGAPIFVSTGVTVTNDVINYGMPFYDFFQIQHLGKISYEEFEASLKNLATIANSNKTVHASIKKNKPRQQSICELTGGSPRLAVILFEQIAKGISDNINDDLEKLADASTPLYKAKFEELPAQQQIILNAIALNWDAASLKKLSILTRMKNNQLSPQLKRLIDSGWIEATPAYKAKGNAYFIAERFFNIYYIIRNSSRRHKNKVYCLSEFLECFYRKEEKKKLNSTENNNNVRHFHLNRILSELHKRNKGLASKNLLQVFENLEKEDKLLSVANDNWWAKFGSIVLDLGYASWLLAILEEKDYDIVLSPYYTAIQALEIEKQNTKKGKAEVETYLRNRPIEISDPARTIIAKIKNIE